MNNVFLILHPGYPNISKRFETTFRNEKETWHKELLEEDNLELYVLILHNRKKNGNLCQLDCGDPWNDEK